MSERGNDVEVQSNSVSDGASIDSGYDSSALLVDPFVAYFLAKIEMNRNRDILNLS